MTALRERVEDERGLVKTLVVFALFIAVFGVAAIDGISVLSTRFRLADLAQQASFDAAAAYQNTRKPAQACEAAIADVGKDGKIPRNGCLVNTATGEVTVTVKKTANTIAFKRFGFLSKYTHVEATESSQAPP